jgi:hypothetical protein
MQMNPNKTKFYQEGELANSGADKFDRNASTHQYPLLAEEFVGVNWSMR